VTGDGDPFRDREFEATESREEPVISKDARVREELVMRRTADERDETVRDTVRRTEVDEDRGDGTGIGPAGSARNPGAARTP
jgi:stress response protein YsnF